MSVSFLTKSQQFVFVDPSVTPPVTVNPEAVQPNRSYDIYLVLENTDDFVDGNVQVNVTHSAFGIGKMAGTDGLTQPAPVNVPPDAYGIAGTASVRFSFLTPPGGHGCLGATIASNGAYIGQNVTVVSVPIGAPSTLSFLVFGGAAAESMVLTLTEQIQGGAVLPAGSPLSWHPLILGPGMASAAASPVTLQLAPNDFYSVALQLIIPSNATTPHVFHIVGNLGSQAGPYEGEVDITVAPAAGLAAPDPYLGGGYQSADVLLFDQQGNPVPLGGQPNGRWDTLLVPDTDYKLAALVHNDSPTAAVNTVVRFWSLPGGVGAVGSLLDVRTATIPALGSVQVNSDVPFHSAAPGQHRCAVVSIYNAQSHDATVDAVTSAAIPDPNANIERSASAWRNSDSMFVIIGKPWSFVVQGTLPAEARAPLTVTAAAQHVAVGFESTAPAVALRRTLQTAGARSVNPLYLVPSLRTSLPAVDLKLAVGAAKPISAVLAGTMVSEFPVSGVVPADAKAGDVYLVRVSAKYGDRTIEFLESLYVQAG